MINKIVIETEAETLKEVVEKNGANLTDADLTGADLKGADLRDANLTDANLKITQKEDLIKALGIIIEE